MFSSEIYLKKRTPANGTDRENFLSLLVDEYLHSHSIDAKCQVLANLGNFAYDPINYGYIRDVGVLDIFLHVIKHETNERLMQFAVAGVCNLSIDPLNADYIVTNTGLNPLIEQLKSSNSHTVADVITTLIYLAKDDKCKTFVNVPNVIHKMKEIKSNEYKKLSNLATIFLEITETENSP